jgi:hypothetical protein
VIEVTQAIPDACYICQKINYTEIRKQKAMLQCCKCPPCSAICIHSFLMFDATQWRVPVPWKRFTRHDNVDLFGTQESGNVSLTHSVKLRKNKMPGSVWQWTLIALVKKTSFLALWLFEDKWQTGAIRLHDMTCVGSCIVTAVLCVY